MERYEICWDPRTVRGNPTFYTAEEHFKLQHVEPLYLRAIQGRSGDAVQQNFFAQKLFEKGATQRSSTTSGTRHLNTPSRTPSRKEALRDWRSRFKNRGRQAVHFTLVSPMNKNPDPQFRGLQALDAEPRRDLRCGHGASEGRTCAVFQTPNVSVACFDTIPKSCLEKVSHTRDKAETYTNTRMAYSPKSRNSDNALWKSNECSPHVVVGCRKRQLAKERSWRHAHARNEMRRSK